MRRWYCNAMRESRSPPPFNEEPQISKDFWGFFVFLPADLFLLRLFFFSLNISLSRRFRRWRRFFLIDYFSPTDFTDLHRFFSLIIFLMDLHGFSLIFFLFLTFLLFSCYFFISQILDLSVWDRFRRFSRRLFFSTFYEKFV